MIKLPFLGSMAVDRTFHRYHSRRVLEASDIVGEGVAGISVIGMANMFIIRKCTLVIHDSLTCKMQSILVEIVSDVHQPGA